MDILIRIKRLVARGQYRFSRKALDELELDGLDPQDAVEAVLNAQTVLKVLRSTSSQRSSSKEKLYVIEAFNYSGTLLYTKGKITKQGGEEVYYFFVSSRRSRFTD